MDPRTPAARRPKRLPQASLEEEPYRRHDCRSYAQCLDEACAGRWESWSCTGCDAFAPAPRAELPRNPGRDS